MIKENENISSGKEKIQNKTYCTYIFAVEYKEIIFNFSIIRISIMYRPYCSRYSYSVLHIAEKHSETRLPFSGKKLMYSTSPLLHSPAQLTRATQSMQFVFQQRCKFRIV